MGTSTLGGDHSLAEPRGSDLRDAAEAVGVGMGGGGPDLSTAGDHAVLMLDPGGLMTSWNVDAQQMFQFPSADMLGQDFGSLWATDRADPPAWDVSRALRAGRLSVRGWCRRRDGVRVWVEAVATTVRHTDGALAGLAVVVRDLTPSSLSEEYSSILEGLTDGVVGVDEAGRIVFANRAAEVVFGYERAQLVGAPVDLLVPEHARTRHAGHRQDYRARSTPRAMGGGLDLTGVRRDGSTFPVEVSLSVVTTAAGPVTAAVVRDLSVRRRAEEALQISAHHLALAERIAHLGSWQEDLRTGAVTWSGELYGLLGADPEQVPPSPAAFLDRIHPEDRAVVGQLRAAAVAQPGSDPEPVDIRVVDGGEVVRTIAVRCHLEIDADGLAARCYGTALDVTLSRQRAARDRYVAEVLQRGLLPDLPHQVGPLRIAMRYEPVSAGAAVGGDWADVFPLPGGLIGFAVGDVAGHGVESATTMVRLQQALRVLAADGDAPNDVITRLNQAMGGAIPAGTDIELVTLVYGHLDPNTGRVRYCSAGHPPLITLLPERGSPLDGMARPFARLAGETPDPPLAAMPGTAYTPQELHVPIGGSLIAYTDGLIERRGTTLTTTLAHLMDHLDHLDPDSAANPETLADALMTHLAAPGAREDDTAVLVLNLRPGDHVHRSD